MYKETPLPLVCSCGCGTVLAQYSSADFSIFCSDGCYRGTAIDAETSGDAFELWRNRLAFDLAEVPS